MKPSTIINKLSQAFVVTAALSLSVPAFAALSESEVEPLLKKEGCMKCHALDKTKKGPSYKKIAGKYKGKPEGEEKVIKNLTMGEKVKLEDGTEEEHKVLERNKDDLKVVAKWVLNR